jgi:hypothetical protein
MVSLSPIPVLRTSQIIDNRKFKINFKKKKKKKKEKSMVWWCIPVIATQGRLRQEVESSRLVWLHETLSQKN